MDFNLSKTQLAIIVVAAFAVLLLLAWPCLKTDYARREQNNKASAPPASRGDTSHDSNTDAVALQQPLDQFSAGYGHSYHIVGCKNYECSNNPNDLGLMACGVDDFSIWNDGSKKQFNVNPTYGDSCGKGRCHLASHPVDQDPLEYRGLECCK